MRYAKHQKKIVLMKITNKGITVHHDKRVLIDN